VEWLLLVFCPIYWVLKASYCRYLWLVLGMLAAIINNSYLGNKIRFILMIGDYQVFSPERPKELYKTKTELF
jgi:hypothetical protein